MSSVETEIGAFGSLDQQTRSSGRSAMLLVFTTTLFVSALLLFSVQPLFTKMVLPRLGGSPSVWSVAMVFFQGMLLAGYGYAHALARFTRLKTALIIHTLVLLTAFATLPITVSVGWGQPPQSGQAFWLIGLFAVSVGLPFFAVAANGPLLQAWFAKTDHPHASDPYFLYGASNVGSFAALISYPILFEPVFTLGTQAWLWSAGFAILTLLIVVSGFFTSRRVSQIPAISSPNSAVAKLPLALRAKWVGLAFVPSALLVAVTQHVSTDIAAAPFMWVMPLALFLLTFVITFQRNPVLKHSWMSVLLPLLAAPLVVSFFASTNGFVSVAGFAALHFTFFFVAAMVCHGELVSSRPAASHLTAFYLWMSFGGVLGGIFTGLVAPAIFSTVLEYPLLVVAVFLCRSPIYREQRATVQRDLLLVIAGTLILLFPGWRGFTFHPDTEFVFFSALVMASVLIILSRARPARHFALVASVLLLGGFYKSDLGSIEYDRSFFGVSKIAQSADGQFRLLFHGTTLHGAERIRNEDGSPYTGEPVPTTYYYKGGPLSQAISALHDTHLGRLKVAAIGLGTGSLACAAGPKDQWKFFEIDPAVVKIARDSTKFRFLARCGARMPIVIGDARLTMASEEDSAHDLIIVDAFSSDAIPLHLITKEAVEMYLDKLSDRGAIAFHISNRHMRLAEVVASIAAENGLVTFSLLKKPLHKPGVVSLDETSMVAIVARRSEHLGHIAGNSQWRKVPVEKAIRPWSDDYSNIISAIYRHYSRSYEAIN